MGDYNINSKAYVGDYRISYAHMGDYNIDSKANSGNYGFPDTESDTGNYFLSDIDPDSYPAGIFGRHFVQYKFVLQLFQ